MTIEMTVQHSNKMPGDLLSRRNNFIELVIHILYIQHKDRFIIIGGKNIGIARPLFG
jgi:hypothetical protein